MPAAKKGHRKQASDVSEGLDRDVPIDVQYNPEVISGILTDLKREVEAKCSQIQRDVDFMSLSLKQALNLELIKIPTHVKQMSLARFREEFGCSLEAVTRGAALSTFRPEEASHASSHSSAIKVSSIRGLQTPSTVKKVPPRLPREGEAIVSANGSPLGEFSSAVKVSKEDNSIVPPTPASVILDSGDIVDIDRVESLDDRTKQEAMEKVRLMMDNMHAMMERLSKKN